MLHIDKHAINPNCHVLKNVQTAMGGGPPRPENKINLSTPKKVRAYKKEMCMVTSGPDIHDLRSKHLGSVLMLFLGPQTKQDTCHGFLS